ncbi:MAG: VOC family protein [Chloroflexi bacterium]|nr:VOC family protein [Chloroflexota bacterium]
MLQIVWFEIPVHDIERAVTFYAAAFGLSDVQIVADGTRKTATLRNTSEGGIPGVSLTQTPGFEPSNQRGPWAYIGASDDFDGTVARVAAAGGTMVSGKTSMGEAGSYVSFLDTEGNLLALYTYP